MSDSAVETIIPVPESRMRLTALCPNCGATFYGFVSRGPITKVCALHDQECADLKRAERLILAASAP